MAILRREARVLSGIIPGDEKVHCIAVQHRMDYALLNPSVAVATEKRLVVCSRLFMGIKKNIAFIQYGAIVSMRLDSGIVFSSLRLRLHGSVNKDNRGTEPRAWAEEGEINGLRRGDAIRLAKVISRKMDEAALEREKKEGDYGRAVCEVSNGKEERLEGSLG